MHKPLALLAVAGALVVVAPAFAEQPAGPPAIEACGTRITITDFQDNTKAKPREFTFQATGNARITLADADSSVPLRVPGRIRVTDDPATGLRTVVLSGSTLLIPETPGQRAALEAAGLPELPLIKGRVVLTERFDPQTGEVVPGSEVVVSSTPRVTDVCTLLAR